mgnify:FL=1
MKRKNRLALFPLIITAIFLISCSNDSLEEDKLEGNDEINSEIKQVDETGKTKHAIDFEEAERIYTFSCASCHGNDLSGNVAPPLLNIGDRLSEEEITTIIIGGLGTIPGSLVNEQDAELLSKWLIERE